MAEDYESRPQSMKLARVRCFLWFRCPSNLSNISDPGRAIKYYSLIIKLAGRLGSPAFL